MSSTASSHGDDDSKLRQYMTRSRQSNPSSSPQPTSNTSSTSTSSSQLVAHNIICGAPNEIPRIYYDNVSPQSRTPTLYPTFQWRDTFGRSAGTCVERVAPSMKRYAPEVRHLWRSTTYPRIHYHIHLIEWAREVVEALAVILRVQKSLQARSSRRRWLPALHANSCYRIQDKM